MKPDQSLQSWEVMKFEVRTKYAGYIDKQLAQVEKMKSLRIKSLQKI